MIKRGFLLLWVLLSACNYSSDAAETASTPNKLESAAIWTTEAAPALTVTDAQKKALRLATEVLTKHQYSNQSLAPIALDIHNDYIQALDPNHLFFLQSDIEDFKKYRNALLDSKQGDLSAPIAMYNRYWTRAKALNEWSLQRLNAPLDIDGTDTVYYPKRKELKTLPWFENLNQVHQAQEKRLKDQLIRLMIGGKTEAEALDLLKKRYKSALRRLDDFTGEDLFDVYMNVIANRFDPHSNYLSPRSSKDFNMNMSLQLEGIGAVLASDEDKITIRELIPGGPAYKSGKLHLKDQIIGVGQGKDGEMVDVIGMRLDKAVDLIRGKKGTAVRLLIEPANTAKAVHEITILRDKIKLEDSAASATVETVTENGKTRKLGVIKLPSFYVDFAGAQAKKKDYRSTTRDVSRLIKDLQRQKVNGILIDLRNNGGGSLYEAVQMVGLFIDQGPVVTISQSNGNTRTEINDNEGVFYKGPLAVLINHQSASASEIFAAAIQDYHRGLIIGSTSFGKGTVQTIMDLNNFAMGGGDLGSVKLTLSMFHRVTGSSTQLQGVAPDVNLPEIYDLNEVGERAENYALPWKSVAPQTINTSKDVTPQIIATLEQQNEQRQQTRPELRRYITYVDKMAAKNQQRQWSLNLAERKREYQNWRQYQKDYRDEQQKIIPPLKADKKIKEKIDERNAVVEDEDEKEIFVPDTPLYEALLIFADYIQLLRK